MHKAKHWCAIHTVAGIEKKIPAILAKKGIDSYCPLKNIGLQKGAKKMNVTIPLFTGNVFVYAHADDYSTIKQTNGVIDFLFWHANPAIIQPEEITALKQHVRDGFSLMVHKIPVKTKDSVLEIPRSITQVSAEGILVNVRYVEVHLPSLGYMLSVLPVTKNEPVKITHNAGNILNGFRMALQFKHPKFL